ncbi:MAG: GNAT family N-acetyltransferase [Kiloniellales bacterium]|nr:GNAT family N-acetyltransferase [Kiloniellales bacterium]
MKPEPGRGTTPAPRQIRNRDLDWVLALNRAQEIELSPLTPPRLEELVAAAFYAKALDPQAAFLLAFDQDAAYDSPNFLWFRDRIARFVYVDRITVAPAQRGRGHARALYDDLFRQALARGHDRIVCEVNADPPNPGSDAFHAALGFREVGRAALADRGKSVRYLELGLP